MEQTASDVVWAEVQMTMMNEPARSPQDWVNLRYVFVSSSSGLEGEERIEKIRLGVAGWKVVVLR